MAYGTLLKFQYGTSQALIAVILDDWHSFDGWCAATNCDPLALNSRRMLSLMFYYLSRNLDEESLIKFQHELDNAGMIRHPLFQQPKRRRLRAVPESGKKMISAPAERWRAPKGWKPPGYSEEKSYTAAKNFISFQKTVK